MPTLRTDRQKVKQIVLNLLSNALKFTPQGSVTILGSFDANRREMTIAVRDTGVGIPTDDQSKVFEDFRQLDSSPAPRLRRHGSRPVDLPASLADARRHHRARERAGGGLDLQAAASGKGTRR